MRREAKWRDSEANAGALSNAELTAAFHAQRGDGSASMEEPLDTGLWPHADLSDEEVTSLVAAMHDVQRRDREKDVCLPLELA